jgi:hypothetical protein
MNIQMVLNNMSLLEQSTNAVWLVLETTLLLPPCPAGIHNVTCTIKTKPFAPFISTTNLAMVENPIGTI